jgi:hypothetical protein
MYFQRFQNQNKSCFSKYIIGQSFNKYIFKFIHPKQNILRLKIVADTRSTQNTHVQNSLPSKRPTKRVRKMKLYIH